MQRFKEQLVESDNKITVKKMDKLVMELFRLNDRLIDEDSVRSEIEKYLDAVADNLEMVEV